MNKSHIKAIKMKQEKKKREELQMQGAKYALKVYRDAVQIVLGVGEKRLSRIDDKFVELLMYDEEFQRRKYGENPNT